MLQNISVTLADPGVHGSGWVRAVNPKIPINLKKTLSTGKGRRVRRVWNKNDRTFGVFFYTQRRQRPKEKFAFAQWIYVPWIRFTLFSQIIIKSIFSVRWKKFKWFQICSNWCQFCIGPMKGPSHLGPVKIVWGQDGFHAVRSLDSMLGLKFDY